MKKQKQLEECWSAGFEYAREICEQRGIYFPSINPFKKSLRMDDDIDNIKLKSKNEK